MENIKTFFDTYEDWNKFYTDYIQHEQLIKSNCDGYVYDLIQTINDRLPTQAERDLYILWFRLTDPVYITWYGACENIAKFTKLNRYAKHVFGVEKADHYVSLESARQRPVQEVCDMLGIKLDAHGKAFCPFHNDKASASFKVYPKTNSWYCFGCGASGDGITLVMKKLEKTFKEALGVLNGAA